jgi:cupin 2 domain-containing protein
MKIIFSHNSKMDVFVRLLAIFAMVAVVSGCASTPDKTATGDAMTAVSNIFADLPPEKTEEFFQDILKSGNFHLERIVSHGERSPDGFWYDQEENEWVLLLTGSAELSFADGRRISLLPGDHLLIPRHVRHRVERTDTTQNSVWLALHFYGEFNGQRK